MPNLLLILLLTVLSGSFYLLILLVKNAISRRNLNNVIDSGYGSHSVSNEQEPFIQYSFVKNMVWNSPAIAHLTICTSTVPIAADFIIVRERMFDKLFKLLGISSELQTGHNWFDRRYYVISENINDTKPHILKDEQICKIIDSLLAEGYDYFKYKTGTVKLGFSSFTGWRWFKANVIPRSANKLKELVNYLDAQQSLFGAHKKGARLQPNCDIEGFMQFYIRPAEKSFQGLPQKWQRQRKLWISSTVWVSAIGLFSSIIIYFIAPYPAIAFEEIANNSLLYIAMPITLLHLLAAGSHLSGRARTHKELSWIAALSGIGYSLIAISALPVLNGALDNSPATTYQSKLIDTDLNRGSKGGPDQYYIIVKSWRNSDTEKLQVDKPFYNRSANRINQTVNITTRAGAFNVEWLHSYHFNNEVQ